MANPVQGTQNQQGQTSQMGQVPNQQPGQQIGVPKSQQGTGYTNLQQIMGANQGNQLGQAVAGGIEQTGQQASNALQQGQQQFQQQSQANALGTQAQQQYVQNTLSGLGIGANGQPTNNTSSVTAPTSSQISNFQQYMAGQYGGPTNIANISGIQNQASNAQQQGQEVSSSGGRQALLQQYAANPGSQYSAGDQSLDTALLGATGGKQLQQARQAVSGLTNQVNSASSAAQQQAAQLQNQAQGFGQAVTGQVNQAQQAIYNPAAQQAQQDNATAAQQQAASQAAIQAAQANGTLSAQAAQALGVSQGQDLYGVNLGQYIGYQGPNEQANALNVMSAPQQQQYAGLQQLMGQTPTANAGPAYQAGQNTYNQAGLQSALQSASAPLTALQQQIAATQGVENQFANTHSIAGAINEGAAQQQLAALQQQYALLNGQLGGSVNVTPGTSTQGVNTSGSVQ